MGIRVLIASDYRLSGTSLRRMISAVPDFEVAAETQSIAAVKDRYAEIGPDAVLLDVMVPGPQGLRSVSELMQQVPGARVLVLTANANVSYARAVFAMGVLGYLLRTASDAELFAALRSVAHGRRFIDAHLDEDVAGVILAANRRSSPRKRGSLSNREQEVLRAIARGLTSHQIAADLALSAKTVDTYRARIYHKLGMHCRSDLVQYALATGLFPDSAY
jgi:two-component system response regulator NreC